MSFIVLNIKSSHRTQFIDITAQLRRIVAESGIVEGFCHIYTPHTTAAITINENADPSVVQDIIAHLEKLVPWENNYKHSEGNAAAHIKSSLLGVSHTVFIAEKRLVLGTWQGIYFCEFDGPRQRKVYVRIT
jgi:secondary thiamine-phosphate synthase enzyme